MAELIVVRHARTAWTGRRYCGRSDPPLDGPGRAAARRLAATLAREVSPGTRIVSSPLRRAQQTATAIADALGESQVTLDGRWCEADFGLAEGRTFDELAQIDPRLATRLAAGETAIDWPGGERATAFEARIADAWRDLADAGVPTVLVSHAGALRMVMAITGGIEANDVGMLEPAAFARLTIPAAAGPR
jgi:ribonuclease H / adenosylcobalamin/alpha-ribazole phosphatase